MKNQAKASLHPLSGSCGYMTCDDPDCQQSAITGHTVSSGDFQDLITGLGTRQPTNPQPYSTQDIDDIVNGDGIDCGWYINFGNPDFNNLSDNSDIDFQILQGQIPATGVDYSMSLFRGILAQNPGPQYFNFYKAVFANGPYAGQPTICFTTAPAQFWDVSILRPLIIMANS